MKARAETLRAISVAVVVLISALCITASPRGLMTGSSNSEKQTRRTAADSLCSAGERVVFSAFVEGSNKLVSICSSSRLDDRQGYLQYRFGRPGKVELQFPSSKQNTQKAFTYIRYTRPLVTYLTVKFSTADYQYSIHEDNDAEMKPPSNAAYITITPLRERAGDSSELTIRLRGRVKGSLMNLEDVVLNEPWSK